MGPKTINQIIKPKTPPIKPDTIKVNLCDLGINLKTTRSKINIEIKDVNILILQVGKDKLSAITVSSLTLWSLSVTIKPPSLVAKFADCLNYCSDNETQNKPKRKL